MIGFVVTWPWLLLAIWFEAWGLTVAVWLSSTTSSPFKAWHVNFFFLLLLPVPTLLNVPTFTLSAIRHNQIWQVYKSACPILDPAIANWTAGDKFEVPAGTLALLQTYNIVGERLYKSVQRAAFSHLIGHVLVAAGFLPAAIMCKAPPGRIPGAEHSA
jgi:hypothetical protein